MNDTVFFDNGKWCKTNTCLPFAIISMYKLGGFQLAVLLYIINEYNRIVFSCKPEKGCKVTYDELADMCRCSKVNACKTIKTLLEKELIICTNLKSRKGRASFCYIPNVDEIKLCLEDFYRDTPKAKNDM